MHISKVEMVEKEDTITKERDMRPYTFFSLDASEQEQYNAFRQKHSDLDNDIKRAMMEMRNDERQRREREVQEMFLKLVRPHIEHEGLRTVECFAYYGDDQRTYVGTPYYTLFENNDPFDVIVGVRYWFSTKNETLSCTTNLEYRAEGFGAKCPQTQLTYDLLRRSIKEREQDGIHFPFVSFVGDFIYFASSEFATGLIKYMKDILERVGPEAIEELNVLRREYLDEINRGGTSKTSIKQRVFKEAYERKVEIELVKASLIKPKLTLVQSS